MVILMVTGLGFSGYLSLGLVVVLCWVEIMDCLPGYVGWMLE